MRNTKQTALAIGVLIVLALLLALQVFAFTTLRAS